MTRAEPGGDAHDPHLAALRRQIQLGWARMLDKDEQIEVPLPDTRNWKRVRFRGIEHFTGFRYGKQHHAVAVVFVVDMPEGARLDSERCMRRFETLARPVARSWDVQHEPIQSRTIRSKWDGQPLRVRLTDGHVDTVISRKRFSAAWVAYPAYEDACLIFGMAAVWGEHEHAARQVRERFIREGFPEMVTRTKTKPYRH